MAGLSYWLTYNRSGKNGEHRWLPVSESSPLPINRLNTKSSGERDTVPRHRAFRSGLISASASPLFNENEQSEPPCNIRNVIEGLTPIPLILDPNRLLFAYRKLITVDKSS